MNILIVMKTFGGGTGTFANDLLKLKLQDKACTFTIASLEKSSFAVNPGAPVSYFKNKSFYPERYSVAGYALVFLQEIRWLHSLVAFHKPDIILTVDSHCLILSGVVLLLRRKKIPVVATIHNNIRAVITHKVPSFLRSLIKSIIGHSLNHAQAVVCVSRALAEDVHHYFSLKKAPTVIYIGIGNSRSVDKIKPKTLSRRPILITVTRLAPQKDVGTTIKAFAKVLTHVQADLWIVGDGPDKAFYQSLCKKLSVPSVSFLGWRHDVPSLLKKADIFVFSSHWEGLSFGILEALSAGLPVVATDVPFGPREILGANKYGRLVPPKDSTALGGEIIRLLSDPLLYRRYGELSFKRSAVFTKEKMLQGYQSLLIGICGQSPR